MNDILSKKIEEIDCLLEQSKYDKAVTVLREMVDRFPDEGIIPFYFGRLAMIGQDENLALKYFYIAESKGFKNVELYLSMALLNNDLEMLNDAEKHFNFALKLADSQGEKWTVMSAISAFYIEHAMYLKAEKFSKSLINEFPNNYQGYHVHIMIETMRKHVDEAVSYIEMVPDKFKKHPQYLIDIIEIYKLQGKKEELFQLFENDLRFVQFIPQIVLREKIMGMSNDEETSKQKEELIAQLAREYQDSDAIVSYMIIQFSQKNFKKSAEIANIILENEMSIQGMKYYLALLFQIFNLYYLANKKPSDELRIWIEKSGNWCIEFIERFNIPEVGNTVRDSIQELFDEINRLND